MFGLINKILAAFGHYPSVESIMNPLSKIVTRLEQLAAEHDQSSNRCEKRVDELSKRAEAHKMQADRARSAAASIFGTSSLSRPAAKKKS